MKKRFSAFLLAALMVAALLPAMSFAADGYIKVNGVEKTTFEAAADANYYIGDDTPVVIEVYGTVTLRHGIAFTATDVTIKGMTEDAEIVLENNTDDNNYSNPYEATQRPTGFSIPSGNTVKAGSKFDIQDLKITSHKALGHYTSGHSWRTSYYAYAAAEQANYTNVDFVGGMSVTHNVSFDGCTFTENRANMFCVFVDHEYSKSAEQYDVQVKDCEFTPGSNCYGTFKVANKEGEVELAVEDCVFTGAPNVPAIKGNGNTVAVIKNTVFMDCDYGAYVNLNNGGTLNGEEDASTNVNENITANGGRIYEDVVDLTPAYAGPVMNWVKVNAANNGVVKSGPLAASAGATVTLYPKAAEGYVLDTVEVLDAEGTAVELDGLKFAIPAGGVTVNATFKLAE